MLYEENNGRRKEGKKDKNIRRIMEVKTAPPKLYPFVIYRELS
jgi:hypothetical protein